MKRQALILCLLAGCSAGAPPVPTEHASAPAPEATPQAPMRPLPDRYDNRYASPMPSGSIDPPAPFVGDEALVKAAGLPADSGFELWLVPMNTAFRFGLPHPSQTGGVKLGEARSDADGNLSFRFVIKEEYPSNTGTERGAFGLWLVYPDGKTLAPYFVSWRAGNPTTFQGRVLDEKGRPAKSGTRVKITVTGRNREESVTYYEGETAVTNGTYRFDRVPAPADTTIEAILPSGVTRKREEGPGGMLDQWGCCQGSDYEKNFGTPLTYNFGGPATPEDPLAPAYFLSERLADPGFAWTEVSGHVYDQLGNLVPDSANAIVRVGAVELPSHERFHATVPVRGGRYSTRVPIGVVNFDLRVEPGVHVLINPRPPEILEPEELTGQPNVINFGGPATDHDPDAPSFAFPSPTPVFRGPSPFVRS